MPAHNVVRIQGAMPGGEVWSVNPRFYSAASGPVIDYEELLMWANEVGDIVTNLPENGSLKQFLSSVASITSVRVESISPSGTLVQAAEWVPSIGVTGTGLGNKPFQTAVVASLLTGRPGRSFRGRLYWPALNVTLSGTTLRLSAGQGQAFANAMAEFLTDISAASPADPSLTLSVVSQTLNVATPVNLISVGDVLDVQRRRRDSLLELRSSQVMPYSAP